MNKKILIILMIIVSIILCIPSIIYLINNETVDGFDFYYTYTLKQWINPGTGLISGIIVIGLLLIFSIIYFLIIKRENIIFLNLKQMIIFIALISFIFLLILPYLSSDIYYYIGDSWLSSRYGENPYYTSVSDLQEKGINDEILNNTGYWKGTTSVYGPLWNIIASILVSFSFGNITLALFVFKVASYLIHILNTYLIYKITKSRKYMLLYGINPLILIEFLSNVHNDIYLVLFVLLALYFLIRKSPNNIIKNDISLSKNFPIRKINIILSILFLAISISIKYSTALIVPFILIYIFKDESPFKRIIYCLISGLAIIAFVILLYLPYYKDFTIFTNMLVQGSKYSQSILLFLMEKGNKNLFSLVNQLTIPTFITIYVTLIITLLFKKGITLSFMLRKYNIIMLIFIFGVLTNFQKWYVLWMIPTIIWQSKNMRKFIIFLTIAAIIPSMGYFIVGGDPYTIGMSYSINMLFISAVILIIEIVIKRYINTKNETLKSK